MYFVNAFLALCGIACGMPLLFIANRLSRKYLPDSQHDDYNRRTVELMEERNRLDVLKAECLDRLAACAERTA